MRFVASDAFSEQRRRFSLMHTCEQCAHFDPTRERCVHSYPVEDHRDAGRDWRTGDLVFCKEFELL